MQATSIILPSIHDNVPPLEEGGIVARDGFSFQDHVAVGFLLNMFLDKRLIEVRCESQDDITLIWDEDGTIIVEFVQVKGNKLNQLWSIAKVCERGRQLLAGSSDGDSVQRDGRSIAEKTLANDRFSEESRFRIVTRRDVNGDLKYLCLPITSPSRDSTGPDHKGLCKDIADRTGITKSPKGNGWDYWVSNTLWEVEHSTDAVHNKNISKLLRISENEGMFLTEPERSSVYDSLIKRAQDTALADWRIDPSLKKINRTDFCRWLRNAMSEASQDKSDRGVAKMCEEKMKDASLPNDYIENARCTLESYRRETLAPRYLERSDRMVLEGEVSASLQELRSRFDAGELHLSNIQFHAECIKRLTELQATVMIDTRPSLSVLQGCMYYITGRCGHRFRRIEA